MKVWTHTYQLRSAWHGEGHAGALLKVELDDGSVGYADLHPWPELGDPSLEQCLRSLSNNDARLPLVMQASRLAVEDAQARAAGRSLSAGHTVPLSHRLLPDLLTVKLGFLMELQAENYTHVKVKLGRALDLETPHLKKLVATSSFKWRLDFNGRLSQSQFADWYEGVRDWLEPYLDGVEDPIVDGEDLHIDGPFFTDRISARAASRQWGRVWKPEIAPAPLADPLRRLWITNNLGHPFGHGVAMVMAARSGSREVAGLQGLEAYEPSAWTEAIRYYGPVSTPLAGAGFGGDELLARIPWRRST